MFDQFKNGSLNERQNSAQTEARETIAKAETEPNVTNSKIIYYLLVLNLKQSALGNKKMIG
jgi:hypothetical protein